MIRRLDTALLSLFSIASMAFSSSLLAQSETAATVPASFVGTYSLSYDQINSGGPFDDGAEVTLVLRSDNVLCVDGQQLSNPVFRNGNQVEAIWSDVDGGFEYAVSNFQSSFNEVNVSGANFSPFYGQLSGSKVSSAEDCVASTPTVTTAMTSIFELAESKLSEFFPAGAETQFLGEYVYRFYPSTGVYLAFADGQVLLLGGAFGDAIVDAGSINVVLDTLEVYEPLDFGDAELWTLTISGTFDTAFISGLSFSDLVINDIPAPDMNDLDEIEQSIYDSLEEVASNIGAVSLTVEDDSANRRAFRASFSATTEAGSVTYNLLYVYTR
jgi:hypothetical protein